MNTAGVITAARYHLKAQRLGAGIQVTYCAPDKLLGCLMALREHLKVISHQSIWASEKRYIIISGFLSLPLDIMDFDDVSTTRSRITAIAVHHHSPNFWSLPLLPLSWLLIKTRGREEAVFSVMDLLKRKNRQT